jgi:hypothetical protein
LSNKLSSQYPAKYRFLYAFSKPAGKKIVYNNSIFDFPVFT